MKKIVSNGLIVFTQLAVGAIFLFVLFSDSNENGKEVVIENNNLSKMADSVNELFVDEDISKKSSFISNQEEELVDTEEALKKAEEEKKKAEEEALKKQEEERLKAEEEERKANEEKKAAAVISSDYNISSLQEYARNLVINNYGWSIDDFVALVNLWNEESGWNPNCHNSNSGAHGIPQALPGDKMVSEGSDYYTNGETQIRWGLKYILERYGSPSNAWNHFLSHHWY